MNTSLIKHKGEINLVGVKVPCYVLEDGTRILSALETQEVLRKVGAGYSKQKSISWYKQHLEKRSQTFFAHDKTNPIVGLEATMLEDIFDICLKAVKNEVKLSPKRRLIVEQHEMLLRTFAKVGVIALVDEATGYQQAQKDPELLKMLKLYTLSVKLFKMISENKEGFFEHLREHYSFSNSKATDEEEVSKEEFDKALKILLNASPQKSKK